MQMENTKKLYMKSYSLKLKLSQGKSAVGNSNENYLIGNYFPFNRPKRKGIKEIKMKERMKKRQKG